MAALVEYDLEINQGASFSKTFAWKGGDGLPVSLTFYTARMQVRQSATSPDVLLELTTANGRIALGGALGTVTLSLTPAVTELIEWRRGKYDLELVAPDGGVMRFLEGQVSVSREVTR